MLHKNLREKLNKWIRKMSLVEFAGLYKDFSYIPGDMPHLAITATNEYAQHNASAITNVAISYVSVTYGLWRTSVVVTSIPEPLIPGTKIPVYRITALLSGGMTVEEILKDFPSLSQDKIQYAQSYAADNPNYWRAYPLTSFKRRLREAGFYDAMKRVKHRKG
jgi:uncharacterized protein (DUF433 family)